MYQYTPFTGYWYMILISSGVRVRSVGPNLAMLASLTRSAGFSTFWPRSVAQRYTVYNLTRMNRRSRRTALYDGVGQGSQVLVGVFGQLLIAKFRFQLSRINRAAHITGRVGHLVATYHFSAQAPKASAPLTRALSRAFFVAGDFPSATIRLASPSRSRASASVLPNAISVKGDCLLPVIDRVVVTE